MVARGTLESRRARRRRRLVISERIEERMDELGLSQSELSRKMKAAGFDLSQTLVSRKLNGAEITGDQLVAFAAVLNVTYTWILGLTDDKSKWAPDGPLDTHPEDSTTPEYRSGQLTVSPRPVVEILHWSPSRRSSTRPARRRRRLSPRRVCPVESV
jgi:transcriptional regulator with XRE-family HTH domain